MIFRKGVLNRIQTPTLPNLLNFLLNFLLVKIKIQLFIQSGRIIKLQLLQSERWRKLTLHLMTIHNVVRDEHLTPEIVDVHEL